MDIVDPCGAVLRRVGIAPTIQAPYTAHPTLPRTTEQEAARVASTTSGLPDGAIGRRVDPGFLQHPQRVQLAGRLDDPRQHQLPEHLVPTRRLLEPNAIPEYAM